MIGNNKPFALRHVCEMKFSNVAYEISEEEDMKLQTRAEAFANAVGDGRTIHLTMVTSRGLVPNAYSRNVQSQVVLDDLFAS